LHSPLSSPSTTTTKTTKIHVSDTSICLNSENSRSLNFITFRNLVQQIRAEISNRLLISEEVIVGEIDDDGNVIQVAHKPTFRGLRNGDGKLVEVSIVAVATAAVEWEGKDRNGNEDENRKGGPRVQIENLVLVVNEVEE
jgi:hypothetical protein